MKRFYFDYAATTPVDPRVFRAMQPYFSKKFGNPGSLHSFGQEAMAAIDMSRETVARAIGAEFRQIIFTSSATEANNLALRGVVDASKIRNPKIIISSIEHPSILETAKKLKTEKINVAVLPVNSNGVVDAEELKRSLDENTVLVSIMFGNNEIGTLEPIKELAKMIKEFRGDRAYPLFHTDAAQVLGYYELNVNELDVDLLTLSGQKIYGPKGIGALYVRDPKKITPLILGGNQEFGLRAGTENVAGIVGFAEAIKSTAKLKIKEEKKVRKIKEYFWRETKRALKNVYINGTIDPKRSLPHILNIHMPDCCAEELLTHLDLLGFALSSGSACHDRAHALSHVLLALDSDEERAKKSMRVSFGRSTGKKEVDKLVKQIKKYVKK